MTTKTLFSSLFLLLALLAMAACERVPVGYLQVEHASYTIDSLVAYRKPWSSSTRGQDASIPWTSLRMEGVAGTKPLTYALEAIEVSDGGSKEAFEKVVAQGLFHVQGGGILVLQQAALALLPDGKYIVSLRISNEGHSLVKPRAYTIIVKDEEPMPTDDDFFTDDDTVIDDITDGEQDDDTMIDDTTDGEQDDDTTSTTDDSSNSDTEEQP